MDNQNLVNRLTHIKNHIGKKDYEKIVTEELNWMISELTGAKARSNVEAEVMPKIAEATELEGWTQKQLNAINYAINTWLENDTQIISSDGEVLSDAIIDKKPNSKNFIDRLEDVTKLSNLQA